MTLGSRDTVLGAKDSLILKVQLKIKEFLLFYSFVLLENRCFKLTKVLRIEEMR